MVFPRLFQSIPCICSVSQVRTVAPKSATDCRPRVTASPSAEAIDVPTVIRSVEVIPNDASPSTIFVRSHSPIPVSHPATVGATVFSTQFGMSTTPDQTQPAAVARAFQRLPLALAIHPATCGAAVVMTHDPRSTKPSQTHPAAVLSAFQILPALSATHPVTAGTAVFSTHPPSSTSPSQTQPAAAWRPAQMSPAWSASQPMTRGAPTLIVQLKRSTARSATAPAISPITTPALRAACARPSNAADQSPRMAAPNASPRPSTTPYSPVIAVWSDGNA